MVRLAALAPRGDLAAAMHGLVQLLQLGRSPAVLQVLFGLVGVPLQRLGFEAVRRWILREPHQVGVHDALEAVKHRVQAYAVERTICLQPVDDVGSLSDTCLSTLAAFARAFFLLDVRVLPPLVLDPATLTTRAAPDTGTPQVYTGDILRRLFVDKPADAFCVLGITAHDLFPHPIVSFAFGEASATCRVGVCSVARYGPPFCEDAPGRQPGAMRGRCCRVIAHEIGHMAGITHCIYFRCLMNGSASLAESERRPLRLCPIDLRKLQWLLGFDLTERDRQLQQFWREVGDGQEASWIASRLPASTIRWRKLAALVGHRA